MKIFFRNIIALISGIIIGSIVNMTIINSGGALIAPPEGVNPVDIESIKANIHLYAPIHFLAPFLAHAIGTFVGALITSLIAVSYKMYLSISVGCVFLIGGIMMAMMLPGPMWFICLDLILAYIPMAWLGWNLSQNKIKPNEE